MAAQLSVPFPKDISRGIEYYPATCGSIQSPKISGNKTNACVLWCAVFSPSRLLIIWGVNVATLMCLLETTSWASLYTGQRQGLDSKQPTSHSLTWNLRSICEFTPCKTRCVHFARGPCIAPSATAFNVAFRSSSSQQPQQEGAPLLREAAVMWTH